MNFSDAQLEQWLGRVCLDPSGSVVAGSIGQWNLTFTVGSLGVDEGGTIKFCQRFASDWEAPQFDSPAAPAYTTIRGPGSAQLVPRLESKGTDRPWSKCLTIDVIDGTLRPGDEIIVVLGDQSQGSPGIRAQTFIETAHEFRVLVDPTNAAVVRRVPSSPSVPIVAGPPVKLIAQMPSLVVAGETARCFVKGQDVWGNPTEPPGHLQFKWLGTDGASMDAPGAFTFQSGGEGRVRAEGGGLLTESNPVRTVKNPPRHRLWWADLHAQSDSTVGTGSEEEYFHFARYHARVDVAGHQGNDFQLDAEKWKRINDAGEKLHEEGVFVVVPGYEWSANTWCGGDRNVWFRHPYPPIYRSSHWQIPEVAADDQSPAHPADRLFEKLKTAHAGEVLVGSHVGGRYADIQSYYDQEVCRLIEVCSCWGVFEWMIQDAVERGYVFGIMANSDGHKGRPGAEGPGAGQFGMWGGLTCILSEELSRESVFEALMERRCYATTGARLYLEADLDDRPMGSFFPADGERRLKARVTGTAPLESVEVFEGMERRRLCQPAEFDNMEDSRTLRIAWRGARHRGRGRRVCWDGDILLEGMRAESATEFGFDSPADGIVEQTSGRIRFKSQTTGDSDGIEIRLSDPIPAEAKLIFDSAQGRWEIPMAGLPREIVIGDLDRVLTVRRYPDEVATRKLTLDTRLHTETDQGPIWLRITQTDGERAWTSPFFPQPVNL